MGALDVVLPRCTQQQPAWPMPDAITIIRLAQYAARGKRQSRDVATFLIDLEAACFSLTHELAEGRWYPGPARAFRILDPKPRLISALPFRDRVVQHALIHETLPRIERSFVTQSYACRTGFGTHRCLRKAIEFARTHAWVLRIDMAKFFPSVDHEILETLLRPVTPVAWWGVTKRILDAPAHVEPTSFYFPGDDLFTPFERPHGLPIGNLTSQIWANLMLSPVDHLLASFLGIGNAVQCMSTPFCQDKHQQACFHRSVKTVVKGLRIKDQGFAQRLANTVPLKTVSSRTGPRRSSSGRRGCCCCGPRKAGRTHRSTNRRPGSPGRIY